MLKKFIRQLFCKHQYPELISSTECEPRQTCVKCDKVRVLDNHKYKSIKHVLVTEKDSGLMYDIRTQYMKEILKCEKCGHLTSRVYHL